MKKVFIIQTGGKQYRVSPGDEIWVEKLPQKPKELIELEDLLSHTKVKAEIGETKLGPKISILKFRPKTGYKKRIGHRQLKTALKIIGES